MSHQYCTHIKNKSLHGYVVCGVPFKNRCEAEEFCVRMGMEPSRNHVVYSPKDAAKAAVSKEMELAYICSELSKIIYDEENKLKDLCSERDRLEAGKRDAIINESLIILRAQIDTQIGVLQGLCKARMMVRNRRYDLFEISRIPYLGNTDEVL